MQMFLASCSQMRCHYLGLVSDLLFSTHLLNWMTERPACRRVQRGSLRECCLLTSPPTRIWALVIPSTQTLERAVDKSFATQWSETWALKGDYKQTQ